MRLNALSLFECIFEVGLEQRSDTNRLFVYKRIIAAQMFDIRKRNVLRLNGE